MFLALDSHLCPAAGVLADNLFFLFNSVLSAATTGLVARAWPKGVKNARQDGSNSAVGDEDPRTSILQLLGGVLNQPFLVKWATIDCGVFTTLKA